MNPEQYPIIAARRLSYVTLVWQAPSLAMAAQAFLLAASFDSGTSKCNSMVLAAFAAVVGLAAIQLIERSRFFEVEDSEWLAKFEADHASDGYVVLHGKRPPTFAKYNILSRISAFTVWRCVLIGLVFLSLYGVIAASFR